VADDEDVNVPVPPPYGDTVFTSTRAAATDPVSILSDPTVPTPTLEAAGAAILDADQAITDDAASQGWSVVLDDRVLVRPRVAGADRSRPVDVGEGLPDPRRPDRRHRDEPAPSTRRPRTSFSLRSRASPSCPVRSPVRR
jgi:hypothetical protein